MVRTAVALGLTVATLAAFTALGLWYSRGRIRSVEDLITARNSAGDGLTAATLLATGMGAWVLFTPAEAGAVFGGLSALLGYTVGAVAGSVIYIWLGVRIRDLIPEGHSLTEYVYVRYGQAMYVYVLLITIFYMFLVLSAELTGITGALALVAAVPEWQTALVIGVFVLVYTTYGGLIASIFTDAVQTLLILPLFVVSFVGALFALGGAGEIHANVAETDPQLLNPVFVPGLEFGLYVSIGILAVSVFHQGYWQRVFAASDDRAVRRGFSIAAVASIPMVLLPGLFGLAAVGLGLVGGPTDGSIAFFLVLQETFPAWIVLAVVLLAVLFVMSTADTMFNAIASIVTADLPLVFENVGDRTLTVTARLVTVVVGAGAILVGVQGYSVLELFLLANLLATATFIPFLGGLYSRRITQSDALVASVAGLVVGLAVFPVSRAVLTPILGHVPSLPEPSFLTAYAGAAVVSGGLALILTRLTAGHFELERLGREIRTLEARADGGRQTERRRNGGDDE